MKNHRPRTWKVIKWDEEPMDKGEPVPLQCYCGYDALCPMGARAGASVIAAAWMGVIFDNFKRPPGNYLPTVIQCRKCRKMYEFDPLENEDYEEAKEVADVR